MAKITKKPLTRKPNKPYSDFPLFPHATRRWAKKIRGKLHYFGAWDDPQGALQRYLDHKDDLHAGRIVRVPTDGLTIRDLMNRFLTSKQRLLESGEIVPRTFRDYYDVCQRLSRVLGVSRLVSDLTADDFEHLRAELAKTRGPVALGNDIGRIRVLFKYGYDQGLIDRPIRYGQSFRKPSKRVLRQNRALAGSRMFEAREIRAMLHIASPHMKAMILLGINCGLGNSDIGNLTVSSLKLRDGWLNYPRPKTGIERRCPLWPETVVALRDSMQQRHQPVNQDLVGLFFITSKGQSWNKERDDNPIAKEIRKLTDRLGIHRRGLGFYGLRRAFETVGGEARDQVAVDFIMGHAPDASDMAALYRQRIGDKRLHAVVNHVHEWLFSKETG